LVAGRRITLQISAEADLHPSVREEQQASLAAEDIALEFWGVAPAARRSHPRSLRRAPSGGKTRNSARCEEFRCDVSRVACEFPGLEDDDALTIRHEQSCQGITCADLTDLVLPIDDDSFLRTGDRRAFRWLSERAPEVMRERNSACSAWSSPSFRPMSPPWS
jgi:hypothetical protein